MDTSNSNIFSKITVKHNKNKEFFANYKSIIEKLYQTHTILVNKNTSNIINFSISLDLLFFNKQQIDSELNFFTNYYQNILKCVYQDLYSLINLDPNAEVEGGETMMAPNGESANFNGPTHENGGIPVNLTPGTMIFSDRLKDPISKKTFAELAKKYNHPSMCITDHGNMSNVYNFYTTLKKHNLKAIIGCEFYLYNNYIFDDSYELKVPTSHQIVLVKNKQGYINANKLNYDSFTKTFYRKPLIKRSELYKNKEGIIITSSCAISEINQFFGKEKDEEAIKLLKTKGIYIGEL